jgi:TonB-linked SusC/RagA family outer membrane protein
MVVTTATAQVKTDDADKVTEDRMNKGLVTTSIDALTGQAAGVQVSTGGNQEAMVSAVRVRGTTSLTGGNDPLVIIDGVTADLATLSTIYPSDIESFTILKDASETAQYGSRGAAGVIQVATKKGRGQPFHIAYDGTFGFERVFKRASMLNAQQFRQAAQRLGVAYIDRGDDTNFGESIERTGVVENHHIAFGGGNNDANYRASVAMIDHKTVIRTNRYRNYIAKLDLSQNAFDDRLHVELGIFGTLQKKDYMPFQQKLLFSAMAFNPTYADGALPDGSYDQVTEAQWINNPNALMQMSQEESNGHFNAHLNATVKLLPGLLLKGFGSFSYNNILNAHYYPTIVWSHGEAYRGDQKTEVRLGKLSLDYSVDIKQSSLNLSVSAEAESVKQKGFFTTVSGFSTDAFGYDKLSAGATRPWGGTDSYYNDSRLESFSFRAQYSYLNRYTLTVSARADGSSKVGVNNRWGYFPSVSGSWEFGKEPWMKSLPFISSGKLRVGYGLSGSLGGIGSYNSLELLQPNGVAPMNGTVVTTLGLVRNANPDLNWEVKRTFNVGVDVSLWNRRMAVSLDFYRSAVNNMLYVYDVPVPPFPYDKLLANLGSMRSQGLEIGFGVTPLRTRDMELSVNMNWAFTSNKLVSLNGYYNDQYVAAAEKKCIAALWGPGYHGSSDVVMQVVGEPLGVFYLPHCNGLVTKEDGSKEYDVTSEKYICGQATPKATMGSNVALRYREWDITVQLNGAFGHKIFNGTALATMNMLSLPNYNVMEGAPEENIQDQTISDYWLERGDYVNIDYVTLGWNVPVRLKHVQALRLSASINNLATITGYSGVTPMINSTVVDGTLGIDDRNTLPAYRSYSLGVRIQF